MPQPFSPQSYLDTTGVGGGGGRDGMDEGLGGGVEREEEGEGNEDDAEHAGIAKQEVRRYVPPGYGSASHRLLAEHYFGRD